ncbi:MAG: BcepIL02 [Alphaproteobacteria bacterium]|jgi:hypothetical protein|nr:BcepIL02 [Alphaproteobacteria bacterium]
MSEVHNTADEVLAGLTPEERAALAEPDDENPNATQGELEDAAKAAAASTSKDDDEDDDQQPAAPEGGQDSGADPAADVDAAAAAAADPAAPADAQQPVAADEPRPAPSAPVLVVEAPADAEAKLAAIGTQKADLRKHYDDGDLTFDEYEAQKDELVKQERTIERQVERAQLATEMELQRRQNEWVAYANNFAEKNGYTANPRLYRALDMEVRDVAKAEPNLTDAQVLSKAHANLVEAGIAKTPAKKDPAPAPAAKKGAPKPDLPPDISRLPAAAANNPGEGRFASLDRLMDTNPGAYEAALAKLSDADREAYLAE